jgi:hypothetical protein
MKMHALWFTGFLIALGTFVVLFRSYEDRHRFVLLRADTLSGALMWDTKLAWQSLAIRLRTAPCCRLARTLKDSFSAKLP